MNIDTKVEIYGKHWLQLGFSRNDPFLDFKRLGIFSMLILLKFHHDKKDLANELLRLSNLERFKFPYCCIILDISFIVIELLKEELLYKLCN